MRIRPLLIAAAFANTVFAGTTELVSRAFDSSLGNAASTAPRASADGRFVVFVSAASNLVPSDTNGVQDVFVADRFAGTIARASLDANGSQTTRASGSPAISGDGRFVAFDSPEDNLIAGDVNGKSDVYVRDMQSGVLELASINMAGANANGDSVRASLSFDGSIVVFESNATNLDALGSNGAVQIWSRDRTNGVTQLVSADASGLPSTTSRYGCVSSNGGFVVFASSDPNLVPLDTNAAIDVFVRDIAAGMTERVSVSGAGAEANGSALLDASISADGLVVAFASAATNLVAGDTNEVADVFVRDRGLGVTTRISVASGGAPANGASTAPVVSDDGLSVVFTSTATNLLGSDTNANPDVYLRNLASMTTELISRAPSGLAANAASGAATLSSSARWIAFQSSATNFGPVDANSALDVYIVDRGGGNYPVLCVGAGLFCPCSNDGGGEAGCANSTGEGTFLRAFGTASVAQDSLVLYATNLPIGTTALFFQGTLEIGGGLGVAFGDGLTCTGGTLKRLGTRSAPLGSAALGALVPGTVSIAAQGLVPPSGGTRFYQAWYRNSADFCTSATFNLSNGVRVDWQP